MTSTNRPELRTTRSGPRFPLRLVLVAAAATTACRSTPLVTPVPASAAAPVPAARACPAPDLGQVGWVLVADSTGVLLALPPGFHERASGGPFRHFESADAYRPYMTFGFIRGDLGLAAYRRAYQPELMLDYSECADVVSGYSVSIQAWRTPNGVFRNYRRYDRYDVFAIWELRPGVYAHLTGGADQQPTQVLMLAAIRAWTEQKP